MSDLDTLVALATNGGPASIDAIASLARRATTGGAGYIDPTQLVSALLELRVKARSEKNFSLADEIRDIIVASGINVMDTPDGSTWALK